MLQKKVTAAGADIGEGGAKAPPLPGPLGIDIVMGPSLKENLKGPNLGGAVWTGRPDRARLAHLPPGVVIHSIDRLCAPFVFTCKHS